MMSSSTLAAAPTTITPRVRDALIAGILVLGALVTLYALFFDQGALLSPALGEASYSSNYLHEFAHDARHLFGLPCH